MTFAACEKCGSEWFGVTRRHRYLEEDLEDAGIPYVQEIWEDIRCLSCNALLRSVVQDQETMEVR